MSKTRENMMNSYEVQLRKRGDAFARQENTYNIVAGSLEDAITRVKTEIPNDFGSEFKYELVSVKETARSVLLPESQNAGKKTN